MLKIALCSAEAVPFAKTGGLADVVGALPFALKRLDTEILVIMPGYAVVFSRFQELKRVCSDVAVSIHEGHSEHFDLYCKELDGVKFYFIKNDQFFGRQNLYGGPHGDYEDNNLRFGFFSKAIFELLKKINFKADIIHLHDYHSAMCAFFLADIKQKESQGFFKDTKTVLTIHNLAYQGIYEESTLALLGIERKYFHMGGLEFYGKINYLKGGIIYADKITTVSPTYAQEILTKEFGHRLEGVLQSRSTDLTGIINGIDYEIWDPKKDPSIAQNYDADDLSGKLVCKKDLLESLLKSADTKIPVLGMVSRLSQQKGLDILADAFEEILQNEVYIVILGTGDAKYMDLLDKIRKKYRDRFSLNIVFSDELARKIYAGSDIFLMPSQYEPCGLGQLISLKYGSVPLIRSTGGLADTIIDIKTREDVGRKGQGFQFFEYSAQALYGALKRSLTFYKDQELWKKIVKNAMDCDFSWDYSAKKYKGLFHNLMEG